MACPSGTTHRYVLFLHTHPHPDTGAVRVRGRFTFCLVINSQTGAITGVVDESRVAVTGTNLPIGGTDIHRMTLEFFWNPSRVILDGFTFPESGGRREFVGRFIAVAPIRNLSEEEEARARMFVGPDPGESGTGNGNNT